MNNRRTCPIVVLALTLACDLATDAREPAPDPTRFVAEINAFEAWDRQNSVPTGAVLFVGSSSIRMWKTAESFPDLPVINRGFGGSVITDATHFAPRIVVKYRPRVIVFYSGDNDIAAGMSPQKVFDDFRAFAELIHKKLPETRIIFLPIKPSLARWNKWPQMQEANALVAELANTDDRLDVVDTATPMLGADGQPRSELFLDDGLHMNEEGYAVWNEILAPALRVALPKR
jgi:lysophospholipase L1-like esterase